MHACRFTHTHLFSTLLGTSYLIGPTNNIRLSKTRLFFHQLFTQEKTAKVMEQGCGLSNGVQVREEKKNVKNNLLNANENSKSPRIENFGFRRTLSKLFKNNEEKNLAKKRLSSQNGTLDLESPVESSKHKGSRNKMFSKLFRSSRHM